MGKDSSIEWTDHTFNAWWGCAKVSPGCAHCYAESWAKRTGHGVWGKDAQRRFFGDEHWNEPIKWNERAAKAGVRHRVFSGSMCDVFEDRPDLSAPRQRLFRLIAATKNLDWLLLTKRPENIASLAPVFLPNIWWGTSAENQEYWDKRVPVLLRYPAPVHFVSAEPLLGPIQMGEYIPDWVIVGGESGPNARPMNMDWARALREDCAERCHFFFKQIGGRDKKAAGRLLDGETYDEIPHPHHLDLIL